MVYTSISLEADEEKDPLGVSAASSTVSIKALSGKESEDRGPALWRRLDQRTLASGWTPQGWKPQSMQAPAILAFAVTSFLLAGLVEGLSQISRSYGSLALAKSPDDFSMLVQFGYMFLPTIISIFYGLAWSWVDLDVKRMQPWIELSRPGGAKLEDSLFLDYPFEFIALVPLKAARRKHWAVFLAGLVVVIIFWLITPLQSAVLGTGPVILTKSLSMAAPSGLIPVNEQAFKLDLELLGSAYATTWLNQQLPAFAHNDFVLLPVSGLQNTTNNIKSNFTVSTTKLSTTLSCKPADVSFNSTSTSFVFNNGKGCLFDQATFTRDPDHPYKIMYIGFHSSPYASEALIGPTCGDNSEHSFLAIWAHSNNSSGAVTSPEQINMTAIFCEPSYTKQRVSVLLSTTDFVPNADSIIPLGPAEPVTDKEFNITAFEFLIGTGAPPLDIERDSSFMSRIEQYPRVLDTGVHWPLSPMTGYALGCLKSPLDQYSNAATLQNAFERAHRLLFSLAASRMASPAISAEHNDVSVASPYYGVIVSRPFAIAVECLLLLVALLACALLVANHRSQTKLKSDANSISSIVDLIRDSPDVKRLFADTDSMDDEGVRQALGGYEFVLEDLTGKQGTQLALRVLGTGREGHESITDGGFSSRVSRTQAGDGEFLADQRESQGLDPWRGLTSKTSNAWVVPRALQADIGLLFLMTLIGSLVLVVYFKITERRLGGLPRPSENFEVLQLLENYIPTVFATMLEPLWILVTRLLCVMQPFNDLSRGNSRASTSLDAAYTSVPPQLAIWRALRNRHLLLVLVCATSLVANLLAVGLGGLFNEAPVLTSGPIPLKQTLGITASNATFTRFYERVHAIPNSYNDMNFIALANLQNKIPLPPWLSVDTFFQPLDLNNARLMQTDSFAGETYGFGTNPSCSVLPESGTTFPHYEWTHSFNQSVVVQLGSNQSSPGTCLAASFGQALNQGTGKVAFEIVAPLAKDNASLNYFVDPCMNNLLVGWGRGVSMGGKSAVQSVQSTMLLCKPTLVRGRFNVTVGADGRVLNHTRLGDMETLPTDSDSIYSRIMRMSNELMTGQGQDRAWHNDTVTRTWTNYLMQWSAHNSSQLGDPNQDLVAPEDAINQFESVYKRVFAVLLQQNPEAFDDLSPDAAAVMGTQFLLEERIFLSQNALGITLAVLAMNIVVAVLIYVRGVPYVLPRVPMTVGSTLGYVVSSRMAAPRETTSRGAGGRAGGAEQTFSFGNLVGPDGKMHLGIDVDPYVTAVEGQARSGKILRSRPRSRRPDRWV